MPDDLATDIDSRQAQPLLADAECLARVCAVADIDRLHISDISGHACGLRGYSYGSGHQLAKALGWRDGQPAIGVAVADLVRDLGDDLARAAAEQTALHELAHSLADDDSRPAADLVRLIDHLRSAPDQPGAGDQLSHHHLRWAAGLVILTQRAARYRAATADLMWRMTRQDLERYSHSCEALQLLCAAVDPDAALRPLLRPGSSLMATLAAGGLTDHPRPQQGAVAACTTKELSRC